MQITLKNCLSKRINFSLSVFNDNRGWILIMGDYLSPVIQRLKNWAKILFTCSWNDKENHMYAIFPIIKHHNSVEWVL
jgi:predicted phosphatase